jgi:acetyl-CoA carboxylase biotin carboxyl carrier protein
MTVVENVDTGLHEIKSPIVGTFYRAPAPDADSYVQVGDNISVGSVLCIVEAMKLMNEIESDVSGKIVKVLVENGKPVEYNQPLFLIKTS